MSTRPGEGFQQEAAEAFGQTNMKQAEKQVCPFYCFQLESHLAGGLDGQD